MEHLLKDKRVVIVGPSQSIIGSNNGELINSFDVIVRMNSLWPPPANLCKDIGSRTDIHYNNGVLSKSNYRKIIENMVKHPLKLIAYDSRKLYTPILEFCEYVNTPIMDYRPHWNLMNKNLKCLCNTGTVAISQLSSYPLKELFITGITFGQEPYFSKYPMMGRLHKLWEDGPPRKINGHLQPPQIKWFLSKMIDDCRIKTDEPFMKIINERYPEEYNKIKKRKKNIKEKQEKCRKESLQEKTFLLKERRKVLNDEKRKKNIKALAFIKAFKTLSSRRK